MKLKSFTFRLLGSDHESVVYETDVTGNTFEYPSDAPALSPGASYYWTVQPSVKLLGDAAEPAELVVVGSDERSELGRLFTGTPDVSVERAKLYVDRRLWYDSIEVYTSLIAANPNEAQPLLERGELFDQLPQTKEAAKVDYSKAEAIAHL